MRPQPTETAIDQGLAESPGDAYWAACQGRIAPFVDAHYRWPGVWRVHRAAFGLDLVKAPANLVLALPALLSQLVAPLFDRLGAVRLARWFSGTCTVGDLWNANVTALSATFELRLNGSSYTQ